MTCWRFSLGGEQGAWRRVGEELPQVIGAALARLPRFGCHTPYHYSVGRHSRLLALYLAHMGENVVSQLLALLHDASEVLGVGDINANVKRRLTHDSGVAEYEHDVFDFVLNTLGISAVSADHAIVHSVDKAFGPAEARIMGMRTETLNQTSDSTPELSKWLQKQGVYDELAEASQWLEMYTKLRSRIP